MKIKKLWDFPRPFLIGIILAGVVIGGIFTGIDRKELNETIDKTRLIAKNKLQSYNEYTANDRVKSLVRLLDKTKELSNNLDKINTYDQQDLDDYIAEQRISGAFILNKHMDISLQGTNYPKSKIFWKEISNKNFMKEVLKHPEATYTERIKIRSTEYDLAVISRKNKTGLVITYVEKNIHTLSDMTLESVFADFPISMKGVITVCLNDKVVSTNKSTLIGKTTKQLQKYYNSDLQGNDNKVIRMRANHKTWYGHKDKIGEYVIYMFFPASQVFMTRSIVCGSYIAVAILIYLLLLLAKSNLEKAALKQSQKRMRIITALSTAYSSITLFDLINNTVEVIKKSESDVSVLEDELLSKKFDKDQAAKLFASEYRDEFIEFLDMETVINRLKGHQSLTYTGKLANGKWILAVIVPQRFDQYGNITAVLLANRDVTKDKEKELEQEQELRDALAVAEHANRAKTNFLNSISHDIRTPMNAIIGFTSLATTHVDNKELVKEYLKKINVSSRHLLSLINDVLDMSRIESGVMKLQEAKVNLTDIFQDLKFIIQNDIADKQQQLSIDTQDVIHQEIMIDKLRLNQVILNIVSNAIKFTPVGGMINIKVSEYPCDKEGYARYFFRVKDNGIGMSKEFQKHIFDSFSREQTVTKSGIQGTGLGMAISKNIVNMMGGTITVNSEPGKGSEFVVCIDCKITGDTTGKYELVSGLQEEGALVLDDRYAGKKVLLVEDNELNREIATAILEEAGLIVEVVEDGTDAVARMNLVDESEYDVILMDIQMPKMDGYTTTREIRTLANNKKANIPIIAMTANAFEEDKQKALEAGMNGHIAKPININAIMNAFDQIFSSVEV